jgi:hypothetical protein
MAHINVYNQGDLIRTRALFTTADGIPADPTTVTVKIKDPAKAITSKVYDTDPEVVKLGTGSYQYDHLIDQSGRWYYSWIGTGTVQVSAQQSFVIRRSQF